MKFDERFTCEKKLNEARAKILILNNTLSSTKKELDGLRKRINWCKEVESKWSKYDTKIKNLQKKLKKKEYKDES